MFRRRFSDLVQRQLGLFESQHADLLRECSRAEREFGAAGREDAEERYGDLADQIEWTVAELEALRDTYAATLEERAAADYAKAFDRAARKRFPRLAWAYTDA